MSQWLKSPRYFAPGTKMTFAGLSKPEDRANVMAYLNSMSGSPIPVPPPPAVDTPAEVAAEEADQGALPGKAEDEPVLNEAAAQQPRSEEHPSELQSLLRTSYAVFCLKKKNITTTYAVSPV